MDGFQMTIGGYDVVGEKSGGEVEVRVIDPDSGATLGSMTLPELDRPAAALAPNGEGRIGKDFVETANVLDDPAEPVGASRGIGVGG